MKYHHVCKYLLLFLCTAARCSHQLSATITSPLLYNAYLHSEALGTFSCVAEGSDDIRWVVDGELHNFLPEARGIEVYTQFSYNHSEIRIPALLTNKHIAEIKCRAYNTTSDVDSVETAQYNIQGLLDRPPNITYSNYNSSHNTIEWQEPYTLDITGIEPDIENYTVCVNVSTDCMNTTEPHFNLSKYFVPILVTVTAWNIVGESNSSAELVIDGCVSENQSQGGETFIVEVAFEANNITTLHISFPESQSQRQASPSDQVCLYLYEVTTRSRETMVWSTTTQTYGHEESFTVRQSLPKNHHYTISVNRMASSGTLALKPVDFSTYDLQNVDVMRDGDTLLLTCEFALGSTTKGFTIELVNETGTLLQRHINTTTECASQNTRPCTIRTSFDFSQLRQEMVFGNTSLSVSTWEESGIVNNVLFEQLTLLQSVYATSSGEPPMVTQQEYTTHQTEMITVILSASIGGGALGTLFLICVSLVILGIFCKKVIRRQDSSCIEQTGVRQEAPPIAVPNEAYALILQMNENDAYQTTLRKQDNPTTTDEVHLYEEIDLPPTAPPSEPVYAEVAA